ncbi:hypothetical protein Ssi02_73360 [Sinosporangium siamense]|uniref:Uncharacterized protein n=1 Tax=Sinosporangium siamense TaxID=1367973 RepID=A0A919RNM5_9ACTN|nr:hypothetical protein Ssi02_73360 [Sinosporangium siamense]
MEEEMSASPIERIRVSALPAGFEFRKALTGKTSAGFNATVSQVTLVHTRGAGERDWSYPLSVHIVQAPQAVLLCTEARSGVPVDLEIRGVKATYHDGLWSLPDGEAGASAPVWRTDQAHSVTVWTASLSYGVRGPRDVPVEKLLEVARSLPLSV